jgi:hypothetical protein
MPPHCIIVFTMMDGWMHLYASPGVGARIDNAEGDVELPWEPAGHGAIATCGITKCQEFWRTFVRSPVVMSWIEEGYRLLWTVSPPARREFANAPSALEHSDFVSGAVEEMLAADAVTLLAPRGKANGGEPSWGGAEARNRQVPADG